MNVLLKMRTHDRQLLIVLFQNGIEKPLQVAKLNME